MNATEKNESEFDFQFEFDFNIYRISSSQSVLHTLICDTYKSIEEIKHLLVKAADAEKRRMERWLIEILGVSGGSSTSLSDGSNSMQIEKLAIELDEKRKMMRSLLKAANLNPLF